MNIKPRKLTYRYELKYLINYEEKEFLKHRLRGLLQPDGNVNEAGEYKIRSLYFDDYWNSAYETKLMGVQHRSKYRIRIYNDSDTGIYLERKIKNGQYIAKERAALTRDEVYQILEGDYAFLEKNDQHLCKEFYYECMANIMRPRVVVDYEREPYVFLPGDVRITFDRGVRSAKLGFDIFDPELPTLEVLEPGKLVLEVKFIQLLPEVVRKLLPPRTAEFTSVSKYTLCCENRMQLFSGIF